MNVKIVFCKDSEPIIVHNVIDIQVAENVVIIKKEDKDTKVVDFAAVIPVSEIKYIIEEV